MLGGCSPASTGHATDFGSGSAAPGTPPVIQIGRLVTGSDEKRASSGHTGCAPEEIAITDNASSWGTETWTATCHSETYRCSRENGVTNCMNTSAQDAAKNPPEDVNQTRRVVRRAFSSAAEPEGAAGFVLGASVEDTQKVCEGAQKVWSETSKGFSCSGTPQSIGLPAVAFLHFCEEKLCSIELRGRPEGEASSTWIQSFSDYNKALEKKYGGANVEERTLPTRCQRKLVTCLRAGDAELVYSWRWETGVGLALSMTRIGKEPTIRIAYKKAAKTESAPVTIDPNAL